ncbi:MAG: hypothetical protein LAQ30_05015 [Acidobacteriia bacterium]|nr:hypothetical protein [Terriglobia bacterium]
MAGHALRGVGPAVLSRLLHRGPRGFHFRRRGRRVRRVRDAVPGGAAARPLGAAGARYAAGALAGGAETPFPPKDSGKGVFLGRPWRDCARTVFLNCWMGEHIRPEGWDNWGDAAREKTAWYAELGSSGPGANPAARVTWARTLNRATAAQFAPDAFLKGRDGWNPLR